MLRVRLLFSSRVDGVPRARYTKNFLLLVCARALFLVPREPVRALARLAAVPRAVDVRDARVPAAAAISERMRRERNGFRANATRPLSEPSLPKASPDWP